MLNILVNAALGALGAIVILFLLALTVKGGVETLVCAIYHGITGKLVYSYDDIKNGVDRIPKQRK